MNTHDNQPGVDVKLYRLHFQWRDKRTGEAIGASWDSGLDPMTHREAEIVAPKLGEYERRNQRRTVLFVEASR